MVTVVSFLAYNRSSNTYNEIAIYVPHSLSYLTDNGQYLKGRVTLMNITQSTKKAVITFKKLMCIDDTLYQCRVNYIASSGVKNAISNSTTISFQVPPSKPDHLSMLHTPETVTLSAVQIANQNATTTFNYSTAPNTNLNTTYFTSSNADFCSDSSNKSTTYTTEITTSTQGIAEGDNITIVCSGHVGNPPSKHVFQKYRGGRILSMNFTATETSISQISENCSYYRTSNFTFQVTAQDSNAVIRCAVDSPVSQFDNLYLETALIEVYCLVIGTIVAGVVIVIVFLIVIIAWRKNTTHQPAVYARVNETTKSKNKQKTETLEIADKPEEEIYVETQERIHEKAGDRRLKENENVEHFDSSYNLSNDDTKLSIQTSQLGSHANQAFEKDKNRKVAIVSPTIRSSGGSQDDKQTNKSINNRSKKWYENILGTDQTGTSEDDSSHLTAL
ncbi:ALCAM [Mytilus coruscus]|uniref:ALCAM n=1 Tax=Mytilus coruscus TaxID=42192 RepID=A0A6J8DE06_MYTCO|nr:ALCAM [Mytilus coruscus]